MVSPFRKIRQRLLRDNKFSKYLIYAFGDIILMVLGILIALQINTWNETKHDRSFEIKMLTGVQEAIRPDENFCTEHQLNFRNKTEIEAIHFFDRVVITNNLNKYSADYHFNRLNFGLQPTNNRGSYDALKTSGIDKASNDEIRNKLMHFYDFILPRYQGLINYLLTSSKVKMIHLVNSLSTQTPVRIMDGSVECPDRSLKNINSRTDEGFNELLFIASDRAASVKFCLQKLVLHMLELRELFENEINK